MGLVVSEEKSFEIVDGRRTTTEPAYTISSPGAFGSGELKNPLKHDKINQRTSELYENVAVAFLLFY